MLGDLLRKSVISCAVRRTGAILFACAFLPGSESWADDSDYAVTAALGVETVSVFRGQKSTKLNPSAYAMLELERGDFFSGVIATPSSIAGEVRPFVLGYAGYEPSIGGFDVRAGGRYYTFPGSSPFEFDLDDDGVVDHAGRKGFLEVFVGAARVIKTVKLDVRAFYSPDIFGETGGSLYVYSRAKAPIGHGFELRADVGVSEFARDKFNDDYVDYGIGVHKSALGFDFFLRYSDTVGLAGSDDRVVVFGIEKAWTLAEGVSKRSYLRRKILNRDWRVEKALIAIPNYSRSGD